MINTLAKFPFSDDWSVFDLGGGKRRIRGKVVGVYDDHEKFHVPPLDDNYYTVVLELKKKRLGCYYLKFSNDELKSLEFKMGEAADVSGDYYLIDGKNILLNVKRT